MTKTVKTRNTQLFLLSLFGLLEDNKPLHGITLQHKEKEKSGITARKPKPGKNKPAKNYDPVTKTWTQN
jgi:hypothetical protein